MGQRRGTNNPNFSGTGRYAGAVDQPHQDRAGSLVLETGNLLSRQGREFRLLARGVQRGSDWFNAIGLAQADQRLCGLQFNNTNARGVDLLHALAQRCADHRYGGLVPKLTKHQEGVGPNLWVI